MLLRNARTTKERSGALDPEWAALIEVARPDRDAHRLLQAFSAALNWPHLLRVAERHALLPLLSARLQEIPAALIPPDVLSQLREQARARTIFSLGLAAEMFRVLDCFRDAGIEILATKGPVLSMRCYGDPALRQYNDLDFIVRTKDIGASTGIMTAVGYEPRISLHAIAAQRFPGEYAFRRPGTDFLIEFHTEHTFRYHPRRLNIDKAFANKTYVNVEQRRVPALSTEDEFILICIHAAKHLWERFAWVADVAALLTRNPEMNWERLESAASEVGAERMLRVGLSLAANMLGAPLHLQASTYLRNDRTATRMAEEIALAFSAPATPQPGVLRRALFRVKMRGGLLPGLSYLLRLSVSPTEDDWGLGLESPRSPFLDAVGRPFRLAKKYRRRNNPSTTQ